MDPALNRRLRNELRTYLLRMNDYSSGLVRDILDVCIRLMPVQKDLRKTMHP